MKLEIKIKFIILMLGFLSLQVFATHKDKNEFALNIVGLMNNADLEITAAFYGKNIKFFNTEAIFNQNKNNNFISIDTKFRGLNKINFVTKNSKDSLNKNLVNQRKMQLKFNARLINKMTKKERGKKNFKKNALHEKEKNICNFGSFCASAVLYDLEIKKIISESVVEFKDKETEFIIEIFENGKEYIVKLKKKAK